MKRPRSREHSYLTARNLLHRENSLRSTLSSRASSVARAPRPLRSASVMITERAKSAMGTSPSDDSKKTDKYQVVADAEQDPCRAHSNMTSRLYTNQPNPLQPDDLPQHHIRFAVYSKDPTRSTASNIMIGYVDTTVEEVLNAPLRAKTFEVAPVRGKSFRPFRLVVRAEIPQPRMRERLRVQFATEDTHAQWPFLTLSRRFPDGHFVPIWHSDVLRAKPHHHRLPPDSSPRGLRIRPQAHRYSNPVRSPDISSQSLPARSTGATITVTARSCPRTMDEDFSFYTFPAQVLLAYSEDTPSTRMLFKRGRSSTAFGSDGVYESSRHSSFSNAVTNSASHAGLSDRTDDDEGYEFTRSQRGRLARTSTWKQRHAEKVLQHQAARLVPFSVCELDFVELCNGDKDAELKLDVMDYNNRGPHFWCGSCTFSFRDLEAGFDDPKHAPEEGEDRIGSARLSSMLPRFWIEREATPQKVKSNGALVVQSLASTTRSLFDEYVKSGTTRINPVFAVDISRWSARDSNTNSRKLGSGDAQQQTERAIYAVHDALRPYIKDDQIAAFGYGSDLKSAFGTDGCLNLAHADEIVHEVATRRAAETYYAPVAAVDESPARPMAGNTATCSGADEVVSSYHRLTRLLSENATADDDDHARRDIMPVLQTVVQGAAHEYTRSSYGVYTVVFLFVHEDSADVIVDAVCELARFPASVMVVDVSNGTPMPQFHMLQRAGSALMHSSGTPAGRCVVQIVNAEQLRTHLDAQKLATRRALQATMQSEEARMTGIGLPLPLRKNDAPGAAFVTAQTKPGVDHVVRALADHVCTYMRCNNVTPGDLAPELRRPFFPQEEDEQTYETQVPPAVPDAPISKEMESSFDTVASFGPVVGAESATDPHPRQQPYMSSIGNFETPSTPAHEHLHSLDIPDLNTARACANQRTSCNASLQPHMSPLTPQQSAPLTAGADAYTYQFGDAKRLPDSSVAANSVPGGMVAHMGFPEARAEMNQVSRSAPGDDDVPGSIAAELFDESPARTRYVTRPGAGRPLEASSDELEAMMSILTVQSAHDDTSGGMSVQRPFTKPVDTNVGNNNDFRDHV